MADREDEFEISATAFRGVLNALLHGDFAREAARAFSDGINGAPRVECKPALLVVLRERRCGIGRRDGRWRRAAMVIKPRHVTFPRRVHGVDDVGWRACAENRFPGN